MKNEMDVRGLAQVNVRFKTWHIFCHMFQAVPVSGSVCCTKLATLWNRIIIIIYSGKGQNSVGAQKLCESRIPNSRYGLCGRKKAVLKLRTELRQFEGKFCMLYLVPRKDRNMNTSLTSDYQIIFMSFSVPSFPPALEARILATFVLLTWQYTGLVPTN